MDLVLLQTVFRIGSEERDAQENSPGSCARMGML
jgi:hypothetical protein